MGDFWSSIQAQIFENEAAVETRLVLPLLYALGYDESEIVPKAPIVFQQGKKGRKHEADFIVYHGVTHNAETSLIVVEVKSPDEGLAGAKQQAESYAFSTRAPLLLLTDGVELEIWQLQAAMASECVLKAQVSSLVGSRGEIESLIGKEGALTYCRSLHHKSIVETSGDYSAYEIAELKRTASWANSVLRTLLHATQAPPYRSDQLLEEMPRGAIVLAPSGYGKTTLSYAIHRQALLKGQHDDHARLSFHLGLSDLADGEHVLGFIKDRLTAHCPAVTEAALKTVLRDQGAILICDRFELLSQRARVATERYLRNLTRDFPRVQIFVFSRGTSPPELPLDVLTLELLDEDQQLNIVNLLAPGQAYLLRAMPTLLRQLCKVPLLLTYTVQYWLLNARFPTRIDRVFQSWLENLLVYRPGNEVEAINCELALSTLAVATAENNISKAEAVSLLLDAGQAPSIFDDLVRFGAVWVDGDIIQLQHEALADYLRAKSLAAGAEDAVRERIATVPLAEDSWFPIILLALLRSAELRKTLWERLAPLIWSPI